MTEDTFKRAGVLFSEIKRLKSLEEGFLTHRKSNSRYVIVNQMICLDLSNHLTNSLSDEESKQLIKIVAEFFETCRAERQKELDNL